MTGADLPPLSDAELVQLAELLARFAYREVDQFDHWALRFPEVSVYIDIWQGYPPTLSEDVYTQVWPIPDHLQRKVDGNAG